MQSDSPYRSKGWEYVTTWVGVAGAGKQGWRHHHKGVVDNTRVGALGAREGCHQGSFMAYLLGLIFLELSDS